MAGPWEKYAEAPIDRSRPILENGDGSFSTERTITAGFDEDGQEVFYNIPTIVGGRDVGQDQAIRLFKAGQNKPVGRFGTLGEAESAAQARSQNIGKVREGDRQGPWAKYADPNSSEPPIVDLPAVQAQRPDFSDVSADVDSTESSAFDWRGLPYVVKPSQMNDGSAGEFFAGHARDAGRSVRSALRGVGGVLDILGEPIAQGIDYVTQPKATLGDLVSGQEPERTLPRQVRFRELGDMAADAVGVGRPETAGQRVVDDIGQALSGTAATMGAGSILGATRAAASNPTVASGVGEVLRAQPGLQVASAATGAGAAGLTREAGGGTGSQIAAGVLGSFAPGTATLAIPRVTSTGIVPDIVKESTRRAFRGGASGEDVQSALGEFQAAGTTPSVGQATGNRIAQGLETFLGSVPGGAGRMAKFAESQGTQVGSRLDDLAATLTSRGATANWKRRWSPWSR